MILNRNHSFVHPFIFNSNMLGVPATSQILTGDQISLVRWETVYKREATRLGPLKTDF